MTLAYDADGLRRIREGTPLEATGLRLANNRELQVPGRHGVEEMLRFREERDG